MGMSLQQLFELNKNAQISPEAAGEGFAIAIAFAKKYHGQETSSIQVLREAGIPFTGQEELQVEEKKLSQQQKIQTTKTIENRSKNELYKEVYKTYLEQSEGWKKRNLFERQWVSRDFKKTTGRSIDEMLTTLKELGESLKSEASTSEFIEPLSQLASYYVHQQEQLKSFEKNPQKLDNNLKIIEGWVKDANALVVTLRN